jgi:hypothetical protein
MEKTLKNTSAFFIANIWLQLGWRPPCEVSKNLVVPVAFSIGHGVIWPLIVSNRVIKSTKKYLFMLLFQLKTEILLLVAFTDVNVECRLFFLCQMKIQAQLLI